MPRHKKQSHTITRHASVMLRLWREQLLRVTRLHCCVEQRLPEILPAPSDTLTLQAFKVQRKSLNSRALKFPLTACIYPSAPACAPATHHQPSGKAFRTSELDLDKSKKCTDEALRLGVLGASGVRGKRPNAVKLVPILFTVKHAHSSVQDFKWGSG